VFRLPARTMSAPPEYPMHTLTRRSFLKSTAALGAASLALPSVFAQTAPSARKLKCGHTGITWGYKPEGAEQAIKDVASLGFHGFESFGHVLEFWDKKGGLEPLLEAAKLPLISAYCPMNLTDASKRKDEVAKIVRWGKLIKRAGGKVAVVGPDNVKRTEYDFTAVRANIVAALNDFGLALADVGLVGGLHPHTGSCVQTRDEVFWVFENADTRYAKMAPDMGELLHGGADPQEIVTHFLPIIVHAHLKDWVGGQFNDGYCPLGKGKVDVKACVDALEKTSNDIMLMAELNPNNPLGTPKPPLDLARDSRDYLKSLGYTFLG
jgi:inosose dehydratase